MELLDLIFPSRCVGCGEVGTASDKRNVCARCALAIHPLDEERCPLCALPGDDSEPCPECIVSPPPFESVDAVFEYGGTVADAVRRAKYGRDLTAWRTVVDWARPHLTDSLHRAQADGWTITAVPMASRSARRRGFDPPAIALEWLGIRPQQLLHRSNQRSAQAGLAAISRLDNARQAFRTEGSIPLKVCVFDDVITTGGTLRAVSEKLLMAGAEHVCCVAIARTPRRL